MRNILLIVLLIVSEVLSAQNTISGQIMEAGSHVALTGVNVFIPELSRGTVSDVSGKYELSIIPAGRFKVQYSYIGYITRIISIDFNETRVAYDVEMEPAVLMSDEVVITGGTYSLQDDNAVKIEAINRLSMIKSGTPNYVEALSEIPGVDMISRGPGISKPVVRGLSMNDVLVLNNGIRMENYQFGENHPLGLSEYGIEKVEVIKGPASLLYGSDAIGGVINFIHDFPAPVGKIAGEYNMQYNTNNQGVNSSLGINGSSGRFFSGVLIGLKSNRDYTQGGGGAAPNTRFNEQALKACLGMVSKAGSFKLYYDYIGGNLGMLVPDILQEKLITRNGRKNDVWYQHLKNHLVHSQNKMFLGDFKLDVQAAFQHNHRSLYEEEDKPGVEMVLRTLTYEARINFPLQEEGEIIAGFQGMNQQNKNIHDRETLFLPDAWISNYSIFGLYQYPVKRILHVQVGLRYDYRIIDSPEMKARGGHSHGEGPGLQSGGYLILPRIDRSFNNLSASVGATYHINEKLLTRVNWAAGYRAPNLPELTSNGIHAGRFEQGNPELSSQRSNEFDVSSHYHSRLFSFDLALFYNHINDYIYLMPTQDTAPIGGGKLYRYEQTDAGLYGGEAGIHFHPHPVEWLHISSSYAMVVGKRDDGSYLPFIPAHQLNTEIRIDMHKVWKFKEAFFKVSMKNYLDQDHPAPFETSSKGYTLLNLGIGGSLSISGQPVRWGFNLNNLLDTRYINHLSTLKPMQIYNPGRNVNVYIQAPFYLKQ